jgi:cis-3-alkyl-4-acyloxetan-2-one decarboxylase
MSDFWHRLFGIPYKLATRVNSGQGTPVVLLHGIGRSATVWRPLTQALKHDSFNVVALDLLGSGDSPKPLWPDYDIDTHARSVIATVRRHRFKEPIILVGHSLGALVALRVARLQPQLVKHVVLYEMPLYDGLPEKRRYSARLAVYYAFYEWATRQNPSFGETKKRFTERLASRVVGAELTRDTWQPFIKTLKNSIMRQTAADDIKHLQVPADVIYGSRDMIVIRGKVQSIFGTDYKHVTGHTINASHQITNRAATFIRERIVIAQTR